LSKLPKKKKEELIPLFSEKFEKIKKIRQSINLFIKINLIFKEISRQKS